MKTEHQEKLKILFSKLKSSQEQILTAQKSTNSLEREISLLQKDIDLETINSPEFFGEMKKLEYHLYLDWENPKMIYEFSQNEKFPVILNEVKRSLSSLKEKQFT